MVAVEAGFLLVLYGAILAIFAGHRHLKKKESHAPKKLHYAKFARKHWNKKH